MISPLLLTLVLTANPPQRGASCVITCSGEIVAPVTVDASAKGFSFGKVREEPAMAVHKSVTFETIDGRPSKVYTLVLE